MGNHSAGWHAPAMVFYRRNRVPGATYFFTVTLADRTSRLLTERIAEFRRAYDETRLRRPFETVALVLLPDHLHAVWQLPADESDYSSRWRAIKAGFVRNLRRNGLTPDMNSRGEAAVWQRRFWEHTIRNEGDLRAHVDYVHWNPVKHGYVAQVREWPYSTFHRYVRLAVLACDWAGVNTGSIHKRGFGE